jgi:hypothetical protein
LRRRAKATGGGASPHVPVAVLALVARIGALYIGLADAESFKKELGEELLS